MTGNYYWVRMERLDVDPCVTRAESCRKGPYRAYCTQTSGNILWTVERAEKPYTLVASGPVLAKWMDQPDGFEAGKRFATEALDKFVALEATARVAMEALGRFLSQRGR